MPDHAFGFQIVPPSRQFRFGAFQVDSRAGELRKHGIRIRIGQQTFQLLLMLLENPGEVVLREEIRLRLWPNDTVVEFDHSINAAIQKLRAALGESAGSPLFVETLARRGYRFVGTVETAPANAALAPAPETEVGEPVVIPVKIPLEEFRGRAARTAPVFAGLTVLLALIALGIMRPWADRDPVRNWTFSLGHLRNAVVSPDGSAVVYASAQGLILRRMNSVQEIPVYTLGRLGDLAAWSPDGSEVMLRTAAGLFRLPLPGGPPATLNSQMNPTRGFAWPPDGAMVVAMNSGKPGSGALYRVRAGGGNLTRLEAPGLTGGRFFYPEFLPDGKNILFGWAGDGDGELGLYLAALKDGRIARGPILLRKNITSGHYSPSGGGRLLYVQNDNLYAQKLSVSRALLEGTPQKILDGVFSEPILHRADFSVSRNGVLVWQSGRAALAALTWFDRTGRVLGAMGPPCLPEVVRLSPDGKRAVLRTIADDTGYGIAETNRSGFVPLPGLIDAPLWISRSSHLLYSRRGAGGVRLLERAAEAGAEREVGRFPELGHLVEVSSDGNVLLYHEGPKLFSVRLDDPGSAPQLLANAVEARFSPDGRWIVYAADTGYRREIYVRPFPAGGLPAQLTSDGGQFPVWRGDGREILYVNNSKIYSLRVQVNGNSLRARPPEALFEIRVPAGLTGDSEPLAVTRDGSKILFAQGVEQPASQQTYVMTLWQTTLTEPERNPH
jgi:DNA-binding winged helix-turn-helix (wHTH) protein